MIRFDVSRADARLINAIVDRALPADRTAVTKARRVNFSMDVTACHRNGNRLDLARLLAADDFNFWHDVNGISRHINRTDGSLGNCFVPRTSAPKKKARGRTSAADTRLAKFAKAVER